MENKFTQQVATFVEERVMNRVQDLLMYPVISKKSTRARVAQNLELLAMMKEYSLNYQASSISKSTVRSIICASGLLAQFTATWPRLPISFLKTYSHYP